MLCSAFNFFLNLTPQLPFGLLVPVLRAFYYISTDLFLRMSACKLHSHRPNAESECKKYQEIGKIGLGRAQISSCSLPVEYIS